MVLILVVLFGWNLLTAPSATQIAEQKRLMGTVMVFLAKNSVDNQEKILFLTGSNRAKRRRSSINLDKRKTY